MFSNGWNLLITSLTIIMMFVHFQLKPSSCFIYVHCGSPRTQSQTRYQLYSCAGGARYAATRVLLPGLIFTYRVLNEVELKFLTDDTSIYMTVKATPIMTGYDTRKIETSCALQLYVHTAAQEHTNICTINTNEWMTCTNNLLAKYRVPKIWLCVCMTSSVLLEAWYPATPHHFLSPDPHTLYHNCRVYCT